MRTNYLRAATTTDNFTLFPVSRSNFRGKDRRRHKRIPRSIGITVQPLDVEHMECAHSFFAITRDISVGGLAYMSPNVTESELVMLTLESDPSRGVVSRVCGSSLIHANEYERVFLTSVEFLFERFC